MTRFARDRRVIFWEEPVGAAPGTEPSLAAKVCPHSGVIVLTPMIADDIHGEARDAAKAEATSKQAATEAVLDKKLADAEKRIADIKAKALADVGAIASEAAEAVVERLIGKKPTSAEVSSAVATAQGGEGGNA